MRVLTLANNKGGVTKTTTTVNLAYGLARSGRRVLVLDTDAQCNTTYSLLGRPDVPGPTLFDVLFNGSSLAQSIVATQQSKLSLVPGSINLSAADMLMASATGRERRLKRALASVLGDYEYVLIDTPPNLGVITVNAFIACTDVLIPIALTTYALIGIAMLERTMADIRENLEVPLPVFGVVANLDDHTRLAANVLSAVRDHFGELVFNTVIPRNITVEESHNLAAILYDYAPDSRGAQSYTRLVSEVIARAETIR